MFHVLIQDSMSLTKNIILQGFRQLGIRSGDSFVMHSSLSSLGWVEGGAETVVEAMLESVSSGGTVFVPTMTFGIPFNPKVTVSRCGKITDVFRRRPDAIRSLSPTHSIAGIGPDAKRILDGHDRTLSFGPNGPDSPLGKLAMEGGSIMLLGVTHVNNTMIHIIQYLAELPLLDKWKDVEVFDDEGNTGIVKVYDPGCSEGFDNIEPVLTEKNAQKIIKIGNTQVRYMKASDVINIGIEAVRKNPRLLLCNRPDCIFCNYTRKNT